MTRVQQEQLVERYLCGKLSHTEEEEFFIQVALNHDLRTTLKAQQIVDSAIRKHREAAAVTHGGARSRLVGLLSVVPETAEKASPGTAREGGRRIGGAWAFALVALLFTTVGAFVIAPLMQSGSDRSSGIQQAAGSTRPSADAPQPATAGSTAPAGNHLGAPLAAGPRQAEIGLSHARPVQPARRSPAHAAPAGRGIATMGDAANAEHTDQPQPTDHASAASSDVQQLHGDTSTHRVSRRDSSLKVRVQVELPH
ncbi:MAG TPA: hypothetical protein VHI13_06255 [Candidatus Kapabacteria bacterium]|nr:hypothetical protein [Candidatus Kapabacteria bacterium]